MRRQTDLPFGQQKARRFAHLPVQPGVRRRKAGPDAIVQPAQNNQIGPAFPRLARAENLDARMSLNGLSDVALRKDRPEQVGVIRRGQQPAMSGFAARRGA